MFLLLSLLALALEFRAINVLALESLFSWLPPVPILMATTKQLQRKQYR